MKYTLFATLLTLTLFCWACQPEETSNAAAQEDQAEKKEVRIISLSGMLTEVIAELGYAEKIVGRDVTSTYPEALQEIPNLGHVSQLNVEAILALKPTLILVEDSQLKQSKALLQIDDANVKIVGIPTSTDFNNAVKVSKSIAKHLEVKEDIIKKMQAVIQTDSIKLATKLTTYDSKPRVLFIYARGTGRLMVAGTNTPVERMIQKSGAVNAISSFDDYKALTPESLVEADPEVILMFNSGLASLDGKEGLGQVPGISQTSAFQKNRIITMDGHYLTAFGPRVVKAALELAGSIHAENLN